jgi:hypothetical protein
MGTHAYSATTLLAGLSAETDNPSIHAQAHTTTSTAADDILKAKSTEARVDSEPEDDLIPAFYRGALHGRDTSSEDESLPDDQDAQPKVCPACACGTLSSRSLATRVANCRCKGARGPDM